MGLPIGALTHAAHPDSQIELVVSAGRQPGDGWIAVGTRRLTALGSTKIDRHRRAEARRSPGFAD
jgi:hypothetical protein